MLRDAIAPRKLTIPLLSLIFAPSGAAASTAARRLFDKFLKANNSQNNQKFPENIQKRLSCFSFDKVSGVYGGRTAHLAGEIPTWNYTLSPDFSL